MEQSSSLIVTAHQSISGEPSTPSKWLVDLNLDGECVRPDAVLRDPFDRFESNECRWYLETYLFQSPYERKRARDTADHLNRYQRDLFLQLFADCEFFKPERLAAKRLTIYFEDAIAYANLPNFKTIHKIHWEILEDPQLWRGMVVDICRLIRNPSLPAAGVQNVPMEDLPIKKDYCFIILLVTARNLSTTTTQYWDVDPTVASRHLLAMIARLKTETENAALKVEIVRPGTFSAFKKHVEGKPRGYYDMIHFDVHG
ncbi:hypothetical protein MMC21_007304 [Puttea exsequens]|nr:hypothetical protein [Puttea exsequens]